ncbi:DeoR/GlpR family DNA-binding transcription regulator [Clostridium tarantellae]|uniref:Lactose phosphotransferase system repressor n=1 Tax=Clostridium tarantellae TaxID=39493 RepID=A0A6I1MKP9_9CLOT|nr:DeoR/GlpR family DNA-binding transcription regulator [Clostridium tarantellae]MPQ42707.1 DeoR family transcriptional regulator [Clostridium tarantellae]
MLVRHNKILELLTENKKIEVVKLSKLLNVSQVTIRKDLIFLEQRGLVIREHGFATLNLSDDLNKRLAYHYETKERIAKLANNLVDDGETIMIESGSCCALFAREVAQTKKNITIITNSAFIADYIRKFSKIKIILLGGEYQHESQVMVGPITKKCVETFFVDKLFIGTDGFSKESGFTAKDYMRSETVRDMAKQANNVIIITESAKFFQKGIVRLIETDNINSVITDEKIPNEFEEYLLSKNINIKKVSN